MSRSRLNNLLRLLGISVRELAPVSGGDINESYRVTSADGIDYFVKINPPGSDKKVITTEAQGLDLLKENGVRFIPEDYRCAENENAACLVMPFYPMQPPSDKDWRIFFENLATMHLISAEYFGGRDNYIGRLPQVNTSRNNWINFYWDCRLKPQLELAAGKGYFSREEQGQWHELRAALAEICPIEKPALIHGDLWNGNILSTARGILLIDPCPCFGHREMDLGMMTLFSGFPVDRHIEAYQAVFPLQKGWRERLEVYQLYYLLAHLNMFGTAYLPGVQRIIRETVRKVR